MSNQWLLDEDRLRWPIGAAYDRNAVLCVDDDNEPVQWGGVWSDSQLPDLRSRAENEGHRLFIVPVRIRLPDVFCDLSVARLSGTADVELSQASFAIVGAAGLKRASRPRAKRRAN